MLTDGAIATDNLERKCEPRVSGWGTVSGRKKKELHIGKSGGILEVMQASVSKAADLWPLLPQIQGWEPPTSPAAFPYLIGSLSEKVLRLVWSQGSKEPWHSSYLVLPTH